jgi:hypothetical protein
MLGGHGVNKERGQAQNKERANPTSCKAATRREMRDETRVARGHWINEAAGEMGG